MPKSPNASVLFRSFLFLLLSRACHVQFGMGGLSTMEKSNEATLGWCQEAEQLLTGQRISSLILRHSRQLSNLLKILNPKFLLVSYRHLTWSHPYRGVWWSDCETCLKHFEESADLQKEEQEFIYHLPVLCVRWKEAVSAVSPELACRTRYDTRIQYSWICCTHLS